MIILLPEAEKLAFGPYAGPQPEVQTASIGTFSEMGHP